MVSIGFSWRDDLAVVTEDGHVRLYTLLEPVYNAQESGRREATPNSSYTVFDLGTAASEVGVASVRIVPEAIGAMLYDGSVIHAWFPGVYDGRLESPWAPLGVFSAPHTLPPLPADAKASGGWDMAATGAGALVLAVASDAGVFLWEDGVYTGMETAGTAVGVLLSPQAESIAVITEERELRVLATSEARLLYAWDMAASDAYAACAPLSAPNAALGDKGGLGGTGATSLVWCNHETVALAWPSSVVLVSAATAVLSLPVPATCYLHAQKGGVHLVHAEAHEYLSLVRPDADGQSMLIPGSTHPAMILVEAAELAQENSPRAYEAIQAILSQLAHTVHTCIAAAELAWEPWMQQRLMNAALYGKTFLDDFRTERYLAVARTLRVQNAVRDPFVGIPAIAPGTMDISLLLYRLAARHKHLLAQRICAFWPVRPDEVVKHWARAKVARVRGTARGDPHATKELAQAIIAQFTSVGALDYAEIALTAWQAGDAHLATLLVDHEVRAIGQVPLLLHMHEYTRALHRAVVCGDTDLIYYVLFRLQQRFTRGPFFRMVQESVPAEAAPGPHAAVGLQPPSDATYAPLAANLLEAYAKEQDHELLRDFYFLDDRRVDQALLCMAEAPLAPDAYEKRAACLHDAAEYLAEDTRHTHAARLAEDASTLLTYQATLDKELAGMGVRAAEGTVVGLSVVRTIQVCMEHGLHKRAERLKNEHRVPDRSYFAAKLHVLIGQGDQRALEAHVGRRPPGGMEPVVSALLQAGQLSLACVFVRLGASDKHSRAALQGLIDRSPMDAHKAQLQAALTPS